MGRPGQIFPDTLITIWHKDPCCGGVESCDWFGTRLTPDEADRVVRLMSVLIDTHFPAGAVAITQGEFAELLVSMAHNVAAALDDFAPEPLDAKFVAQIRSLAGPGHGEPESSGRYYAREFQERRDIQIYNRLCLILASKVKQYRRPWFRHPRWHIHHWRFQFHPWQALKRRHIDRCYKCGKGFASKQYPSNLNGNLYHQECLPRHQGLSGASNNWD